MSEWPEGLRVRGLANEAHALDSQRRVIAERREQPAPRGIEGQLGRAAYQEGAYRPLLRVKG